MTWKPIASVPHDRPALLRWQGRPEVKLGVYSRHAAERFGYACFVDTDSRDWTYHAPDEWCEVPA